MPTSILKPPRLVNGVSHPTWLEKRAPSSPLWQIVVTYVRTEDWLAQHRYGKREVQLRRRVLVNGALSRKTKQRDRKGRTIQ